MLVRSRAPALLALLTVLAAWELALGRIVARGDLLLYFYPLRDFAAAALREGRLPLWNPHTFLGAPFLANSQAGVFYPLNLALSWLPVERATALNIVAHLVIASLGGFAVARVAFGQTRAGAFVAGALFGLGGYLGAQIEHLNQLQVLAWLPFCALIVRRAADAPTLAHVPALSAPLALQISAGHTQSLYISCVALALLGAFDALRHARTRQRPPRTVLAGLFLPALAAALAALISAAQLLPTLELSRESYRAGGLSFNEAGAFSWRPWVAARALLPTFGDPLFAEYVAYLGVAGIALALIGALGPAPRRHKLAALALVGVGALLAFGVATPLFNVLYRALPGFNLFRAQARWLVLFALGAALLAGFGVDALRAQLQATLSRRWLIGWGALSIALALGIWLGARLSPEPEYRALPARGVLVGWGLAWLSMTAVIVAAARANVGLIAAALCVGELLIASQFQPYARTTDAGALTSLRPATAFLSATTAGAPGRVLALSGLFFDPGDKPEQEQIFANSLNADEVYDRLIASKHKEVLSPNLSLYYRLPSVDGYDGGLLPTRRYVSYTQQFASDAARDGRLREFLKTVPEPRWLDALGVRYLIADKTQDVFVDGVFYDLLFSTPLAHSHTFSFEPYDATGLGLVFGVISPTAGSEIATLDVTFADGQTLVYTATVPANPPPDGFQTVIDWGGARRPLQAIARPVDGGRRLDAPPVLRGITLIDARDNTFAPQVAAADGLVRLVYSGDVKIYERVGDGGARATLRGQPLVRIAARDESPERVTVTFPEPLRAADTLLLRDACYPGWTALIDGTRASIQCADGLFREVAVPAGARSVTFIYDPASVRNGLALSAGGLALWIFLAAMAAAIRSTRSTS